MAGKNKCRLPGGRHAPSRFRLQIASSGIEPGREIPPGTLPVRPNCTLHRAAIRLPAKLQTIKMAWEVRVAPRYSGKIRLCPSERISGHRVSPLRPLGIAANQIGRSRCSAVQAAGPVPAVRIGEPVRIGRHTVPGVRIVRPAIPLVCADARPVPRMSCMCKRECTCEHERRS